MDVLLHFQIKKQEEKRNCQLKKSNWAERTCICLSVYYEGDGKNKEDLRISVIA